MKNYSMTELTTIKGLLKGELLDWENSSRNMGATLQDRKDASEQVNKIAPLISKIEETIHVQLYKFIEENA
jgi:hypothetical protein